MYDAFKQLFPTITPYSGWWTRDHPSTNTLAQVFSNILSLIGSSQLNSSNALSASVPVWVYQESLKYPDGPPYSLWVEFYGPVQEHGTHTRTWILALLQRDGRRGIYRNRSQRLRQPHQLAAPALRQRKHHTSGPPPLTPLKLTTRAQLTGGQCSSSCTILSSLLIHQGNVTTVVGDRRPTSKPMAILGGAQGL